LYVLVSSAFSDLGGASSISMLVLPPYARSQTYEVEIRDTAYGCIKVVQEQLSLSIGIRSLENAFLVGNHHVKFIQIRELLVEWV